MLLCQKEILDASFQSNRKIVKRLSFTNNNVHSFVEAEGNHIVPLKQDVLHSGKAPCRNYN